MKKYKTKVQTIFQTQVKSRYRSTRRTLQVKKTQSTRMPNPYQNYPGNVAILAGKSYPGKKLT